MRLRGVGLRAVTDNIGAKPCISFPGRAMRAPDGESQLEPPTKLSRVRKTLAYWIRPSILSHQGCLPGHYRQAFRHLSISKGRTPQVLDFTAFAASRNEAVAIPERGAGRPTSL